MNTAIAIPPSSSPLTSDGRQELAFAAERAKPIRKAARVATFNAWITGIIAAMCVPFAVFSLTGLLVTVGLWLVAYNEFRGRTRLLAFDPSAAKLLGWNQLGLLAMITVYCVWMMYTGLTESSALATEMGSLAGLEGAIGSAEELDNLYRLVVVALYGSVIVLSVVFQGLNALYYFTRRRQIEIFLRETPDWAVDLMRAVRPA